MLATGKKDESVKQPCKPQPEACACLSARLFRAKGAGRRGGTADGTETLAPLLPRRPRGVSPERGDGLAHDPFCLPHVGSFSPFLWHIRKRVVEGESLWRHPCRGATCNPGPALQWERLSSHGACGPTGLQLPVPEPVLPQRWARALEIQDCETAGSPRWGGDPDVREECQTRPPQRARPREGPSAPAPRFR